MSLFVSEIVTPPAHLPITATDESLAAAVVEEIERGILWRAIVSQERRIVIDGPLPQRIEIEPVTAIVSLNKWTPSDDAAVIDAASYNFVSRDPAGAIIAPSNGMNWPEPERAIGSFILIYECGWEVTPESTAGAGDAANKVPASVQLMVERAVEFRAGSGLAGFTIGSLQMDVADSYKTDALPPRDYRHRSRMVLSTGHLRRTAMSRRADAITARIAAVKKRLLAGGVLQSIQWLRKTGEKDVRGRQAVTTTLIDALIEQRPALDRGALSTERSDNTVLHILDPVAITDEHLFRWGEPVHVYKVKAIDGLIQDEELGTRYASEVTVIR